MVVALLGLCCCCWPVAFWIVHLSISMCALRTTTHRAYFKWLLTDSWSETTINIIINMISPYGIVWYCVPLCVSYNLCMNSMPCDVRQQREKDRLNPLPTMMILVLLLLFCLCHIIVAITIAVSIVAAADAVLISHCRCHSENMKHCATCFSLAQRMPRSFTLFWTFSCKNHEKSFGLCINFWIILRWPKWIHGEIIVKIFHYDFSSIHDEVVRLWWNEFHFLPSHAFKNLNFKTIF